jgi:hypothetical protein
MAENQRRWRFFTEAELAEFEVAQRWHWAHFDTTGDVIACGSGFHTLPAAVGDARQHGFRGEFTLGEDGPVWRRFDDWAALSASGPTQPS